MQWSIHKSTKPSVVTHFQQKFEVQLQEAQQRVLQLQQAVQQNQQANQQNVANQGLGQPVNPANQGQGQPVNSANQGPVQPVNSANQGLGQNVNLPNQGFGAGHVQQNQNINEYGRNPLNNQNLHPDNRAMDDTLKFIGQQALVCMRNLSLGYFNLNFWELQMIVI